MEIYERMENFNFKKKSSMPLHSGMIVPLEMLNQLLKLTLFNLSNDRSVKSFYEQIKERDQLIQILKKEYEMRPESNNIMFLIEKEMKPEELSTPLTMPQ